MESVKYFVCCCQVEAVMLPRQVTGLSQDSVSVDVASRSMLVPTILRLTALSRRFLLDRQIYNLPFQFLQTQS